MSLVMRVLRSLLFNLYYFASFVLTPLVLWVCLPLPRPYMQRGLRLWVRSLNVGLEWIAGLAYEVRGLENVPEGAAVFACKHQSAWETTVFYVLADDPAYVLKKELLSIPFWGWAARKAKFIGVDRAGGAGALKRLVRDSSAALDANRQVIIFPEGTRMAPGRTRPYHPGIAALYAATEAPVVPVALNSGVFWGRRRFLKRPGVITLEFLPPVPRGLDRRAFLTELQARIETASERLRAEAEGQAPGENPEGVVDDLGAIQGIGITMQNRLNRAGITTYAQLAEAKPEQVREVLSGKLWRGAKVEAWISEARKLVARK